MKNTALNRLLLALVFLTASPSLSQATTTVTLDLKDARLQAGVYSNRTVFLQPMSTPTISSPSVVLGNKFIFQTDTNGVYVFTNLFAGLYLVTVQAPPSRDIFQFLVTDNNLGNINAADNLVANSTATFPAGLVAWAAAVTDQRYARNTNQPVSFSNVTNALGYLPQPSSINLSNWSILDTNVLLGFSTNAVKAYADSFYVQMNNGGSTNQILRTPISTNLINYGSAISSPGSASQSEQFGSTASASGVSSTVLGFGSAASGSGATAVGENVQATAAGATSVGAGSFATVAGATALGNFASAGAQNGTAIGENAVVTHASSTAIGQNASSAHAHEVSLGTFADGVLVPGSAEVVGNLTNDALTGFELVGTDNNKKLISVVTGPGLFYDGTTLGVSTTNFGIWQPSSANLTNWSMFSTNVLTPIPNKTGTNDVLGIGATNWVAHLNDGSTNQILLSPISTNLVNYGNAIRSVGTTATDDQFGLNATAAGGNSVSVGSSASTIATEGVALGYSASSQGAESVAIGASSFALFANGVALGAGATSQHSGSTAIGPTATTTRANQIILGSGEEVNVPGHLSVIGNITNSALTASRLIATEANKAEQSVTLSNGLAFSGSGMGLVIDTNLTVANGLLSVVGPNVIGIDATNIASSLINPARLGTNAASSSTFLRGDQSWQPISGGGVGTVTSVGLGVPSAFGVVAASTPVTSSGTLQFTNTYQPANVVWAGPSSGSPAAPSFRALTSADLPVIGTIVWALGGNSGVASLNAVGTTDNTTMNVIANGSSGMRIKGNTHSPNNGNTDVILGNLGLAANAITGSPDNAAGCSILGGEGNTVANNGTGTLNTIVGGEGNSFSTAGTANIIGSGLNNLIDGGANYSMILGGFVNHVGASYSLAAGYGAEAIHNGAFVWADCAYPGSPFTDTGANTFNVRSGGGANFQLGSGVFKVTSGGQTIAIGAGSSVPLVNTLSTDQTTSSATLGSTTISVTLVSSTTYTFELELYLNDSVAVDGAKMDFGGGSATATSFRCQVTAFDTALNLSTQPTTLTSASTATTFTGNGNFSCRGYIKVSSGGTFIPRFAQSSHTSGVLTLFAGSHIRIYPSP